MYDSYKSLPAKPRPKPILGRVIFKIGSFGVTVWMLLAVFVVIAVAAFLLTSEARLTGAAVTAPLGNWDIGQAYCNVTGIGSCTPGGGGVLLTGALVGVDDDSVVTLGADWGADVSNDEAICITAVNSLDPNVPATIGSGGTAGTTGRIPGSWEDLNFVFDLSAITPGYDFGSNGAGIDVEWQYFSVVQVGGVCPTP